MPPPQAGELRVVVIGANPLSARLYDERHEKGIRNEAAARAGLFAKGAPDHRCVGGLAFYGLHSDGFFAFARG
jgi:hypothetical protein